MVDDWLDDAMTEEVDNQTSLMPTNWVPSIISSMQPCLSRPVKQRQMRLWYSHTNVHVCPWAVFIPTYQRTCMPLSCLYTNIPTYMYALELSLSAVISAYVRPSTCRSMPWWDTMSRDHTEGCQASHPVGRLYSCFSFSLHSSFGYCRLPRYASCHCVPNTRFGIFVYYNEGCMPTHCLWCSQIVSELVQSA